MNYSGFIKKIEDLNTYRDDNKIPFVIDNVRVGQILKDKLDIFLDSGIFEYERYLKFKDKFNDFDSRTKALDDFAKYLKKIDFISDIMNEPYAIRASIDEEPKALVDRTLSTLFGLITTGVHINGLVKDGKSLKMWIGRRSRKKGFEGGKLDHIAAGGLPYGIKPIENVQKECYEEANIPFELSSNAIPTGIVTYAYEYSMGGNRDFIYTYDLYLPPSFTPKCNDEEVEEFYLMDIDEVFDLVANSDSFKINCNLVIIDFFLRYGYLKPGNKGYLEIATLLKNVCNKPAYGVRYD